MGKRIIELNESTSFNEDDYMVLDNSTDTAKFTFANLWNAILEKVSSFTYTFSDGAMTIISAINSLNGRMADAETNISGKADVASTLDGYGIDDAYTKTDIDDKLALKSNVATTYTKSEVDDLLEPLQEAIEIISSYSNADTTEY